MKSIKGFCLPIHTLEKWSQIYVPEFDLFYFQNKPEDLPFCKITELKKDALTLDVRTSFLTWSIDKKAKYISMIPNDQFQALPVERKEQIIMEQKLLKRGLVFTVDQVKGLLSDISLSELNDSLKILKGTSFEDIVILQKWNWNQLSHRARHSFLVNYAEEWIEENALDKKIRDNYKTRYPELYPFIDTFPVKNGPNCFAAVASAITSPTSYIDEWMQVDPFMDLLNEYNFYMIESTSIHANDVLVWFNPQNQPVHAAYMLSKEHAFNKHGQTMFNPWQVIQIKELMKAWDDFECRTYRNTQPRKLESDEE
jgi:hypothetical protein